MFLILSTIENEQERRDIAALYEQHRHTFLHIAMGITHNKQKAEDAVQDAFVEIIKRKDKIFSLDCNHLRSYLVITVKHRAINIMRKYEKLSDTAFDELDYNLESGEEAVDEQVINKINHERLMALVNALDEKYKTAVEMKYILDFSIKDIAARLSISQENVKTRLHRARAQLKKQLESEVSANG
ncbi:MAG: RNA polymerase sigma factor [Oscillospiraceae bacterium]|nr:RNA polymerase sigma factor [Oscillospiraceae bacterium]